MARAAIARVVTYNGHAASGLFMNEVRIAEKLSLKPYVYEVASIEIPIKAPRNGDNRVRFESTQNHSQHGVDVMYPGAELKVAYDR